MYKSHIYSFIVKFFINYQILIHIRHCGITQEHLFINKIQFILLYIYQSCLRTKLFIILIFQSLTMKESVTQKK